MSSSMLPRSYRRAIAVLALSALVAGCGIVGKHKPATPTIGNRTPILSHISNDVNPDPSLADVSIVLPPAQPNKDWAEAGGDSTKSLGNLSLGDNPQRVWTASIAGSSNKQRLAAAPVVGNGMLYVVDTNGSVNAFDAATGAKRWDYSLSVSKDLRNTWSRWTPTAARRSGVCSRPVRCAGRPPCSSTWSSR